LIVTQSASGYFTPIVPVPDILSFVVASFDGIIRDVTLNKCYGIQSNEMKAPDEKKLTGCLYVSTLKLLGK
ncbi:MAG: hypothetical protein J6X60_12390, partial [Ruminiclostridium sp.]|nr:hypothetical protein [Ruminiclostridium sp.]